MIDPQGLLQKLHDMNSSPYDGSGHQAIEKFDQIDATIMKMAHSVGYLRAVNEIAGWILEKLQNEKN